MNEGKVEVDVKRINALLNGLKMTNKEAKRAIKGGLRKSMQVVQRQARMNIRGVKNEASGRTLDSRNLLQFVRLIVYKNAQGASVNVMDDKRKSTNARLQKRGMDNKSFTLKFFAKGTDDRYTKSHTRSGQGRKGIRRSGRGGFRGRIGNSGFLSRAYAAKRQEAERMLEDSIVEYINKVVSKRR